MLHKTLKVAFIFLSDLFQKLFRQDLLVASLFRNFLLAQRIMRSYDCTPVSSPKLPPTHQVQYTAVISEHEFSCQVGYIYIHVTVSGWVWVCMLACVGEYGCVQVSEINFTTPNYDCLGPCMILTKGFSLKSFSFVHLTLPEVL